MEENEDNKKNKYMAKHDNRPLAVVLPVKVWNVVEVSIQNYLNRVEYLIRENKVGRKKRILIDDNKGNLEYGLYVLKKELGTANSGKKEYEE